MNWDELIQIVARGGPCNASALGGELTSEQVKELLAVAPSERNSRKILTDANFEGITFVNSVSFRNVRFSGNTSFAGAKFRGSADFALVEGSRFRFRRATFDSKLNVSSWKSESIDFEQSTFSGWACFEDIDARHLTFSGSTFRNGVVFGDVKVSVFFNLVAVSFSERVREFVAGCRYLNLDRSRLERGGVFYLHGGQVELSGVEFGASTIIAGTQKSGQNHNLDVSLVVDGGDWRPRVGKLEGADVEKLVLQNVNLTRCRFNRSINLEKLRLDGLCLFDEPPRGLHVGLDPPFLWFWTSRRSVFEERIWRSHSRKAHHWKIPDEKMKPGEPLIVSSEGNPFAGAPPEPHEHQAQAEQLVTIYRALRKGREELKNEPGAGDFYYGEMEMRRAGTERAGERLVLFVYWLLSGYGLRPLRTLLVLVILLGLSSYLLLRHGFASPDTYPRAILASLAAAVNLEYLTPQAFTLTGQWIRIVLKILGPTLFGVLLLAFWGRVKR